MSLLPDVTSLNDAAYSLGLEAIEYSSGGTNPTVRTPLATHGAELSTSASIAAHSGAADEVPPIVVQPGTGEQRS